MYSIATRAANAGHKIIVGGLISVTLFMGYTAFNQGAYLNDRRQQLNTEYKAMQKAENELLTDEKKEEK